MLPDNEPAKESKTATNPANDQAGTSSDGNSSNPTEQESGDMAEVDGGNVNNDEDSDSDADTEVGAPQDAADSSEEMDTDLDSDSDSDMSAVEESEVETTEAREEYAVSTSFSRADLPMMMEFLEVVVQAFDVIETFATRPFSTRNVSAAVQNLQNVIVRISSIQSENREE